MATSDTRIYVENIGTITYRLNQMDRKVRNRTIRNATRAACKVILKFARNLAPRKTGLLRRSLAMSVRVRKGKVYAKVGQRKSFRAKRVKAKGSSINRKGYAAPIWFIEQGTAPHKIAPSESKRLAIKFGPRKKDANVFPKEVDHPGSKPQNLLARTREQSQSSAGRAWYEVVRGELSDLPELTGGGGGDVG